MENDIGTLSYYYDGRFINKVSWTKDERIAHFTPDDQIGGEDPIVNWGFTGTTGDKTITSAIVFQDITGTVNAKATMSASVKENSKADEIGVVLVGNELTQVMTVTHDADSRQDWYIQSGFEVALHTGENYQFKPISGKYKVNFDGTEYEAEYKSPQHLSLLMNKAPLPAKGEAGKGKTWIITITIEAVSDTATLDDTASGTMTGDSGTIHTSVKLPTPKLQEYRLISVPSFLFNSVTMAQVFSGVDTGLIPESDPKVVAVNNYADRRMKLTAKMDSFVLNRAYAGGGVSITFDAGTNKKLKLVDDGKTETLISADLGSQNANIELSFENVELHIDPTFDLASAEYKANIFWTIANAP